MTNRDYHILDKDDFDFKKRFYSLYLFDEIGSAFDIICLKGNLSRNDVLIFAVKPSQYLTSTRITLDYNHTMADHTYTEFSFGVILIGSHSLAKGNERTIPYKGMNITINNAIAFGTQHKQY